MKWPGGETHNMNGMLRHSSAHVTNPQPIRQNLVDMPRSQLARSQDDAMVSYVFQRLQADPDFPCYNKQHPRWALGDESVIDAKLAEPPGGMGEPGSCLEHTFQALALETGHPGMMEQIAPSAKKLWGVEEQKDENKGILNLGEPMWRDTAWSTSDHAVSQPISMAPRRSGSFPGSEVNNVLSPRSSETGGLGVKMVVEYVLGGSSPTGKDLEARMRGLVLGHNSNEADKEKTDKSQSPFDAQKQKDVENGNAGPQTNAIVQNGLEDDKGFNWTPGSRQPSPAEDEINKNGQVKSDDLSSNVTLGQPSLSLDSSHFEPVIIDPSTMSSDFNSYSGMMSQMDSPNVIPQNFDGQLFRNQQQQQQQQQIQLLPQQQQYLATQQQQQQLGLAGPAAFTSAPYVINTQEPYVGTLIAGPTVVPQYYGVAPWGVYSASIIQQGGGQQQRRPLTPSSTGDMQSASGGNLSQVVGNQYQVIPAYYDQNGSLVMGNMRGIGNGTPVRLVSPAPVIVNAGNQGSNMRLLGNQPQQIQTPPASLYNGNQQPSLYTSTASNTGSLGLQSSSLSGGFANLASLQQNSSLGYGNNTLGTIGSPALGSLGSGTNISSISGLGGNSSSRRDSFDRNTSAFSPSLDYGRGKWPQTSYGALGTVTASPGPLGLASGSLTPPPSLSGSTSSLQLGALMSGNRVISAAPGAEAKYRNGSITNGMFGPSNSIFPKLQRNSSLDKPAGRSRLLEEFRSCFGTTDTSSTSCGERTNRFPNLQLRELANHIVEFSQDQHGSRFIQQKLERASPTEKQMVFTEILTAAYSLMTDVFGNYVIQKFFEFGTPEQKTTLAQKVCGHVLPLALQMYGCRVIQKALESITPEQQQEIVLELDGHVLKCVKDQNGNHVVQKCIECVDPNALQFIINAFQGQVFALSTHPYGCRVIQRILEHCTQEQTLPILAELHLHTEQLIQDQYGNYVIQHVLEHGNPEDKSKIVSTVRGKVLHLSQHKFASNVVEKCVTHATRAERAMLIEEVCSYNDGTQSGLHMMMKDQYANYVVQKMIDVAEPAQRKILMHKIRPHISTLRKYTYGKHILAKLEKYFLKNNSDLGPIGPPANGGL